jgi:dihydrofolate reductase
VTTVAKLVYSPIMSLDGYTADQDGSFDWAEPEPDVFVCINELERTLGTHLFGRRMYETLVYWESFDAVVDDEPWLQEFAELWWAASKVVYSTTLEAVSSANTRLERAFDPGAVQRMKETAGHDLSVGGPDLARQALAAGLVDELHLFIAPVVIGGGTAALAEPIPGRLELLNLDRFNGGAVHLHYGING